MQVVAGEAIEAPCDCHVGRGRVLALQWRQPPDRLGRRERLPLEKHLAGRERGGELRARERPHAGEGMRRGPTHDRG